MLHFIEQEDMSFNAGGLCVWACLWGYAVPSSILNILALDVNVWAKKKPMHVGFIESWEPDLVFLIYWPHSLDIHAQCVDFRNGPRETCGPIQRMYTPLMKLMHEGIHILAIIN